MAVLRTQFALLFKKGLGFTESDYGLIITIIFISVGFTFVKLSRTDKWHYRISFLAGAQAVIIITMLLIMAGVKTNAGLWYFFIPAIIFGMAHSAIFLSHQYYSLCGATNRSRQMAIHEMVLGGGNLCGSVIAGQVVAVFGLLYAPYIMGIIAVLLISAAQAVTWKLVKKRKHEPFGTFKG
jgi:predicted MFS family arabinose efflux permease